MAENHTVEFLRDALTSRKALQQPWTHGVLNLSGASETILYFTRKDGTASYFQIGSATNVQIVELAEACEPATFGLNQEEVLDESYRKAGKLDEGNFAWNFNPDRGEFVNKLVAGLFPWNCLDKGVRFEMYKLNVYGQGSFFKSHQDTPRGEDMFGSLVFLLPFKHEGGNLILKHRGREFIFDGQSLLKDTPAASIAYVAFFGDVEHEVAEVTSGNRVTITFNLYFDSNKGIPMTSSISPTAPETPLEHPFKLALQACLNDDHFKTKHPILGFGLQHAYAFKNTGRSHTLTDITRLSLKGTDNILCNILHQSGMTYKSYLLYREHPHSVDKQYDCGFKILSRIIVTDGGYTEDQPLHCLLNSQSYIVWHTDPKKRRGQKSTWRRDLKYASDEHKDRVAQVSWVTEPDETLIDKSTMMTYGNEPALGYFYHQLCVVAWWPESTN